MLVAASCCVNVMLHFNKIFFIAGQINKMRYDKKTVLFTFGDKTMDSTVTNNGGTNVDDHIYVLVRQNMVL